MIIHLTWDRPPLSLNDRGHHHPKAKAYASAVEQVRWCIRRARVAPLTDFPIVATLHWRIPDRRRRDADNLGMTLKACLDGLVAERVIPDDDWTHVKRASSEIHHPNRDPAMWITLEGAS